MYSVLDALSRGNNSLLKSLAGSSSIGSGDGFNGILNSTLRGGSGGIKDIIAGLRERFPAAKVKEGEVAAGVEESKKAADADEDKTSDRVTVGSSLLQGMLGNSDLAKMVQDVIAGFLEGNGAGGLMNTSGSYVQRSVTVTITTVRYTEMHRSGESGEILAASELQASLQDKIKEMMRQLFGVGKDSESENAGSATSDEKTSAVQFANKNGWSSASFMWSMELFYSSSSLQAQGSSGSGSASYNQFQFSASYSSFSGLTSGAIPSALSDYFNGGNGGGISDVLEEMLASFGLSGSGYRQTGEGIFFKLSESRNLIAELMEMYGDRIGAGKTAAQVAESSETDSADAVAETPAEEAVAAVE